LQGFLLPHTIHNIRLLLRLGIPVQKLFKQNIKYQGDNPFLKMFLTVKYSPTLIGKVSMICQLTTGRRQGGSQYHCCGTQGER